MEVISEMKIVDIINKQAGTGWHSSKRIGLLESAAEFRYIFCMMVVHAGYLIFILLGECPRFCVTVQSSANRAKI